MGVGWRDKYGILGDVAGHIGMGIATALRYW